MTGRVIGGVEQSAAALEALRERVRALLNLSAPGDALYSYYALYHSAERSVLTAHENPAGLVNGYVVVCQTGQHLFQPMVTLRTPDARAAVDLLRQALIPGRPYYLVTTPDLRDVVEKVVHIERAELNHVYELDLSRFEAVMNVLVVPEQGPGGGPRFVIRSQGEVASEAGLNWKSPHFAEVYVSTKPAAQGRGWGRSVVSACTQWIVQSGRRPLYIVERGNQASIGLAESLGYVDTGAREYAGEGVCRPGANG